MKLERFMMVDCCPSKQFKLRVYYKTRAEIRNKWKTRLMKFYSKQTRRADYFLHKSFI